MRARREGWCYLCRSRIHRGDEIRREGSWGAWTHWDCGVQASREILAQGIEKSSREILARDGEPFRDGSSDVADALREREQDGGEHVGHEMDYQGPSPELQQLARRTYLQVKAEHAPLSLAELEAYLGGESR